MTDYFLLGLDSADHPGRGQVPALTPDAASSADCLVASVDAPIDLDGVGKPPATDTVADDSTDAELRQGIQKLSDELNRWDEV